MLDLELDEHNYGLYVNLGHQIIHQPNQVGWTFGVKKDMRRGSRI
jgi:hypothetical protein